MIRPLVTGPWRLSELAPPEQDAPTVFSCFAGGGGSSMGWKLAGFRTLGYCEIDPEMSGLYDRNLRPSIGLRMPVQKLAFEAGLAYPEDEDDMVGPPRELYELDVLDGSPPCSSFSMAGSRERDWGKEKVFREGQQRQVLDDLFFHFIDVAQKLRPKVVVAENVKGLFIGKARGYVKEIMARFRAAGYVPQAYLLNSSRMGVPQARERSFFLARRADLGLQPIFLSFAEKPIPLARAIAGRSKDGARWLTKRMLQEWHRTPLGGGSEKYFQLVRPRLDAPCPTITAKAQDMAATVCHPIEPRKFSTEELRALQTFPEDYDFGTMNAGYVMGMSVPPLMMQRVATEVLRQWICHVPRS